MWTDVRSDAGSSHSHILETEILTNVDVSWLLSHKDQALRCRHAPREMQHCGGEIREGFNGDGGGDKKGESETEEKMGQRGREKRREGERERAERMERRREEKKKENGREREKGQRDTERKFVDDRIRDRHFTGRSVQERGESE